MIEHWKDSAFGSDFGMVFLEFIEENFEEELSIKGIYSKTDLEKYIVHPELLEERTDNNVFFKTSQWGEYTHFDELIIGLSAMIVENGIHGKVDLSKAYGNKTYTFKAERSEVEPIYWALKNIYEHPEKYVLFEMLGDDGEETKSDIKEILMEFEKLIAV